MSTDITAAPPVSPPGAAPGLRGHLALTLLVGINLFNYIDRQVLAAVEPQIRRDLGADRSAMGWLSSAFLITYMLMAPVFGLLAERMSRWWLIGIGVALWSLASGGSGWEWTDNLALAYWVLFLTRCLVGVGEAAYGPAAPDVIADLYPIKSRGLVMSFFYLAIPVGGALGYALGGTLATSDLGWRWAFYLVVPPGLLLAALCLFMRDPQRGGVDQTKAIGRAVSWKDYRTLLETPSYVLNTLGMTGMTFAIGGLAYWMADYLEYRAVGPWLGIQPVPLFGGITVIAGFLATLLGGMIGDRLRSRFSGSYFLVSGCAMMLGFPMILLLIWTPFPLAWVWVFGAVFCLFFNTGPTNTILANVTHPAVRATGFAMNILIIHLLGDVLSPPLMGAITDMSNQDVSFIVVSVMMLIGGLLWLWGSRYLERDTALAPQRLAES